MNACSKSLPLLRCDNVSFEVRAWYTNHVPSGAYQGYGAPQGSFAVQMAAAELAAELGIDQLAFMSKNRVREGDVLEILKSLGEGRPGAAARRAKLRPGQGPGGGQQEHRLGAEGAAPRLQAPPAADPDVRIGQGRGHHPAGLGPARPGPGLRGRAPSLRRDIHGAFRRCRPGHGPGHGACQDRRRDPAAATWRTWRSSPVTRT